MSGIKRSRPRPQRVEVLVPALPRPASALAAFTRHSRDRLCSVRVSGHNGSRAWSSCFGSDADLPPPVTYVSVMQAYLARQAEAGASFRLATNASTFIAACAVSFRVFHVAHCACKHCCTALTSSSRYTSCESGSRCLTARCNSKR